MRIVVIACRSVKPGLRVKDNIRFEEVKMLKNIERVQIEGVKLLKSSGWDKQKVDALIQCLNDFTSQAFSDEMYKDAKVELYADEYEQTLDVVWKTDRLNVRVILYDEIAAHWDLFAGRIIDGIKVDSESVGSGGSRKSNEYDGVKMENEQWAHHFYWWL